MASCFLQPPIAEEDSVFSTSGSAEESSSSSSFRQSSSSSFYYILSLLLTIHFFPSNYSFNFFSSAKISTPSMVKGFRLRLSLSSIPMCRSWHPESLTAVVLSPVDPKVFDISYPKLIAAPNPLPSTPNHLKSSSKVTPIGSGCVSRLSSIPECNTNSLGFPKLFNFPVVEELEKSTWSVGPTENRDSNIDPFLTSFSMSFSSAELGGGWLSNDQDIMGDNESESIWGFGSSCDFGYSLKTMNEFKPYEIKRRKKTTNSGEKTEKWPKDKGDGEMKSSPEEKKSVFEKLNPCMVEGKVSIGVGVDMIHDPPILLLDEPTSGLDSSSALQNWIVGKWIKPRDQSFAPRGAHFHQFVVPPILRFRRDCTYGDLAAMKLPDDVEGLGSCEYTMGRGIVHACHAGGVVHALEGWTHHEVGAIDVERIDIVWKAAMKHGLNPVSSIAKQIKQ